jgi:N-acetylneuraminic acid mutarotase
MNKRNIFTLTSFIAIMLLLLVPTPNFQSTSILTKHLLQATSAQEESQDGNDEEGPNAVSFSPTIFAETGVWSTGFSSSPNPKMESAYTVLGDNIYIISGYGETGKRNKNTVEVYNTQTDSWSIAAPVPVNLNHGASASHNGKIYLVGGYLDEKVPSDKLFVYDPSSNQWTEGPTMPTARAALTAQFVNGILYAVGGVADEPLAVNEAYDPNTDTWASKASMPTERQHMASGVVNDILYVLGGRPTGKSSNVNVNEAYDPNTDTWASKASMPTERGGIAAAVANGKIYVFGGEAPEKTFDNTEAYDPANDRWSIGPPTPTARHGLAAATVGDKIYVIGGGPTPDISFANTIEVLSLGN